MPLCQNTHLIVNINCFNAIAVGLELHGSSIKGKESMKNFLCIALLFAAPIAFAEEKKPTTPQTQRGLELFLHSSKGTPCGTCHTMAGYGNAIAPDLTTMATYAPPRGIVSTMHMSMTEHVQLVRTPTGSFPGILKDKQGDDSEFFDLSQMPPVVRKLAAKDITKVERDQKWQHPPAATEYSSQELADIVGFLKWAATGVTKEIKPADVEEQ